MPVIAVLGAGASMLMGGASAIGAVVAGTATLATTLEAVAAVGATLGAVGAITGDKGLQTAGLVMGAVGGVGALAANAGIFGASATTQSLFGQSAASYAAGLQPVTVDGMAGLSTDAGAAIQPMASINPTQDVINSITQPSMSDLQSGLVSASGDVNTNAALATTTLNQQTAAAAGNAATAAPSPASTLTTGTALGNGSTAGQPLNVPTPTPNPGAGASTNAIPPSPVEVPQGAGTTPSLPGTTAPSAPGMSASEQDILSQAGATNAQPVSQTSLDAAVQATQPGRLAELAGWAGKHQVVTYGLLQAGGALVSGMFNPVTPAQISALDAQAAANRAAAALTQQQVANMQSALPTASRGPATSPAVTGKPQGLINTPPPTTANVTGVANTAVPSAAGVGM